MREAGYKEARVEGTSTKRATVPVHLGKTGMRHLHSLIVSIETDVFVLRHGISKKGARGKKIYL